MSQRILFTPLFPIGIEYYPEPAIKNLPDWYKNTEPYVNSKKFVIKDGVGNQTIKKCMPIFDALSAGYFIKSHVDIYISKDENNLPYFNWPSYDPISFHPIEQALLHPKRNSSNFPKWNSPWSIKTPKGYSSLFIPPMHHENNIFSILPGIVDTDRYIGTVNFPFILLDEQFEGMIPAGTIICQIIPFKRDNFKMNIGDKKNIENAKDFSFLYLNKWVNNYKNKFWNKKNYL